MVSVLVWKRSLCLSNCHALLKLFRAQSLLQYNSTITQLANPSSHHTWWRIRSSRPGFWFRRQSRRYRKLSRPISRPHFRSRPRYQDLAINSLISVLVSVSKVRPHLCIAALWRCWLTVSSRYGVGLEVLVLQNDLALIAACAYLLRVFRSASSLAFSATAAANKNSIKPTKISCHGNVPRGIGKLTSGRSSAAKVLPLHVLGQLLVFLSDLPVLLF